MGEIHSKTTGPLISATPYDDVFRTVLIDCRELIYPLLNEVFGTDYGKDICIDFHQNEHFPQQEGGAEEKIIADTFFSVSCGGELLGRYHFECQTNPDSSIILRFFQYDTQIAFEQGVLDGDTLVVEFPNPAVIYLRCSETTPNIMNVRCLTPEGEFTYHIRVLKLKDYSIEELFEKRLYILLPFSLFLYEEDLKECEDDEGKLRNLEEKVSGIVKKLNELAERGDISSEQALCLIALMRKSSYNLTNRYPEVQKGVDCLMMGQVLDYPEKRAIREAKNVGREEGREAGREEGREEGILLGKQSAVVEAVNSLLKHGVCKTAEDAMQLLGVPASDQAKYIALFGKTNL